MRKIGSEYVLFDNYRYGYDAVITQQESCALKNEKTFDFKKYIHNQLKFLLKFTKIFLMINLKMSLKI